MSDLRVGHASICIAARRRSEQVQITAMMGLHVAKPGAADGRSSMIGQAVAQQTGVAAMDELLQAMRNPKVATCVKCYLSNLNVFFLELCRRISICRLGHCRKLESGALNY